MALHLKHRLSSKKIISTNILNRLFFFVGACLLVNFFFGSFRSHLVPGFRKSVFVENRVSKWPRSHQNYTKEGTYAHWRVHSRVVTRAHLIISLKRRYGQPRVVYASKDKPCQRYKKNGIKMKWGPPPLYSSLRWFAIGLEPKKNKKCSILVWKGTLVFFFLTFKSCHICRVYENGSSNL